MDIHNDLMTPREGEMLENLVIVKFRGSDTYWGYTPTADVNKADVYPRTRVMAMFTDKMLEECDLLPVPLTHESRAVERLTAERDALAGQVVELRGALEEAECYIPMYRDYAVREMGLSGEDAAELRRDMDRCKAALSLPLPAAAANVAAMREKAELLDKCETGLAEICEVAARECPHEDHESMADFYSGLCDRVNGKAYALLSALRAARGAQ